MRRWKEYLAWALLCSLVIANEPTLQHESLQILSIHPQTPLVDAHSVQFPHENSTLLLTHTHHYAWSGLASPILKRATFIHQSENTIPHTYAPDHSLAQFAPAGVHVLLETDSPRSSSMLVSLLRDHVMSSMHIGAFSIPLIFDIVLQDEPAELHDAQWMLGTDQLVDDPANHFFYFYRPLEEVPDALVPVHLPSSFSIDASPREISRISFHLAGVQLEFSQQELVAGPLVVRSGDEPQISEPTVELQYTLEGRDFLSTSLLLADDQFIAQERQVPTAHRRYSALHSMHRSMQGDGHHRELQTAITVSTEGVPVGSQCQVTLIERLSEAFFVDQYQVDERRKFGGSTRVLLDHTIDLEKPSYQSSPNVVLSRAYWTCQGNDPVALTLEMPFHTRYQKPASDHLYEQKSILPPVVAISCAPPHSEPLEANHHLPPVEAETLHVSIPVGNANLNEWVTNLTLGITTLGALIVLLSVIFGK